MRKLIFLTTLLFLGFVGISQSILKFDSSGKLILPAPDTIRTTTTFSLDITQPSLPADEIKKKLIKKLRATLDTLRKPEAAKFYQALWSTAEYDSLIRDATNWLNWLQGRPVVGNFIFFPAKNDVDTGLLNKTELLELLPASFQRGKEELDVTLIRHDFFKEWLVNMYNKDFASSGFKDLDLDEYYKRDWTALETLLPLIEPKLISLRDLKTRYRYTCTNNNDLASLKTFYDDTIANLRTSNGVLDRFCHQPIYKKWLWFTNGELRSGPLGFTTPEKKYTPPVVDAKRASLYDKLIQDQINSLKTCCPADVKSIEALVTAAETLKDKFLKTVTDYSDDILGLKSINDLQSSKTILNEVKFPLRTNPKVKKRVITFDGASNYAFNKDSVPWAMDDKTKIVIVAHNVPAGSRVYIEPKLDVNDGLSPAQKSFQDITDYIGPTITALSGSGTLFTKILGFFNPPKPLPGNATIPAPGVANFIAPQAVNIHAPEVLHVKNFTIDFSGHEYNYVERFDNSVRMPTSKEFIENYLKWSGLEIDQGILNHILNNCSLPALNYKTNLQCSGCFKQSVDLLISEFNRLVKLNVDRDSLMNRMEIEMSNLQVVLSGLTQLQDRSLPPDLIKLQNVSKPAIYQSQIPDFEMPEAPKILSFTVIEAKPKPQTTSDSTRTIITKQKVNQDIYHIFQLSAGIGVTLTDYSSKIASASAGQVTVTSKSQAVRIIAGIHIYPWKYFAQSKKFFGIGDGQFRHRLSFYVGLGIPDPLKNFYGGLSLDFLPGFKFIGGVHCYTNYRYKVENNQIVETSKGLKMAGPFIGIALEPASFIKSLGLFK